MNVSSFAAGGDRPAGHRFVRASSDCLRCCGILSVCAALLCSLSALAEKPQTRWLNFHRAEARYRALFLQDENGQIPPNALVDAVQQKLQMPFDPEAWPGTTRPATTGGHQPRTAGISPATWVWLGPGNVGGRIRSILIHPTNTTTMWAGAVGGGVWKTVNGGTSWFPLNDFMANLAIGSMVMDPTDPNVIYAGTGEGFSNADALRGAGIFKTIDGGTNWWQIPTTANSSFYFVNRLSISPTNHLVILAASSTGIWRSTDGGTNWSQRYSTAGMQFVACHATNGARCVASGGSGRAIYSSNGGLSWTAATGLPASGRVELGYAPSSSTTVYASLENGSGTLYVSSDSGVSYTLRNSGSNYLGSQGWYDNLVWVDPTNPNILIVGGLDLWRSTNGGATLTDIGGYAGGIHPDQHIVVNTPSFNGTTIRTIYVGNDGGIFRATDAYIASPGSGWLELNNNYGATQFYGAAGNPTSGTVVGGTQDNGTIRYLNGASSEAWTTMFGGDGGYCAADSADTNYFYGEYVYLQIHRSSNGGASSSYIDGGIGDAGVPDGYEEDDPDAPVSANFIAPFILDPNNTSTMLAGGSNLWRTLNVKAATPTWTNIKAGTNTTSFISAIAVAPGHSDIIWVGHNNGDVYATTNGTASSPDWVREDTGTPALPNRGVTRIVIDPTDPNRVYTCFGGFNSDNIYRTTDGGTTWVNLASGLPAAPVRSLVIAPFTNTYLYAGTEVGVFGSANGGASWSPSNDGGASASVNELFWLGNTLVEATHGRGMFKTLVSLTPIVNLTGAALIAQNCPPGNGAIDPGETVMVNFSLANIVAVPTTNVIATLLVSNGVTAPSPPQSYGALIGGATPTTRPFTFTATGACAGTIIATLQLQDGTNNLGTVSATFPLGQNAVWTENFDSVTAPALPAGWTVSWSGAGSAWATTGGTSDSAPNSAFAPDPSDPSDNQLTSPSVTISNATTKLAFRHSYGTEDGYDGGALEISIAGAAFTDIVTAGGSFASNGYTTKAISTCCSNPLSGRQAWSGASAGFLTTTVNLPAAAVGKSVRFRWRFGTDTGTSSAGWYVDNVALIDTVTCCTGAYVLADAAASQAAVPAAVNLGSNTTFVTTVSNLGPNIGSDIVVTSTLPPELSFVSATVSQGTWQTNGGVVTFSAGAISNAGFATLTVTARTLTNGVFTNVSSVTSSTGDPSAGNNTAGASVFVNLRPTISSIANQVTDEDTSTAPIAFVVGDAETNASALTLSGSAANSALLPATNFIFGGSGSNRTVTLLPATNANGITTVTLTVSDGIGSASTSFQLTVNAVNDPPVLAPISDFVIYEMTTLTFPNTVTDPDVPPQTLAFSLSNAPSGAVINSSGVFMWTPSESQGPGTNRITVIVTDNGSPTNLSDSKAFNVTVLESNRPPALAAIADQTLPAGDTLFITNSATDPDIPANVLTFSLAPPVPTGASIVPSNGLFSLTSTLDQANTTNLFTVGVSDNGSPSLTNQRSFTVAILFPRTFFDAAPTNGAAPLAVTFTNLSSRGSNFLWDFGDGSSGTNLNPVHTFTNAGTYTVTLTGTDAANTNSFARTNYILVTNAPPVASFAASPTQGPVPLTISFTNLSSAASSFVWDFGDGHTSTNANPANTYTSAGSYTVTLMAIGPGGTNTLTRTDYILVTNLPPVANFEAAPTNGLAPLTVSFTNLSSSATNFLWDFGDGNSSTNINGQNTYSNAGAYTVALTAIGAGGTNTLWRTNYILVDSPPPVVDFQASPTSGLAPLTVFFTNLTSGATNYFWDFGEGNSGTNVHPVNTYSLAGSYNVELIAIGPGGANSRTRFHYIQVTNNSPVLVAIPATLDFGLVITGVVAQASILISNAGPSTLDGSATISSGPFTIVSGSPFSLDASLWTNLVLNFSSPTAGVFSNVVVIASNGNASTNSLTGRAIYPPLLLSPGLNGTDLVFFFDTVAGFAYILQYKDALDAPTWQNLQTVAGDGTLHIITIPTAAPMQRFFRLQVQ